MMDPTPISSMQSVPRRRRRAQRSRRAGLKRGGGKGSALKIAVLLILSGCLVYALVSLGSANASLRQLRHAHGL